MAHRPGDRVFAKIKGFSNWPARINPLPPDVQIPKGKLPVFFYGTYQVSFVPPKNIVPYEKFKDKWGKPKSSPQFTTAMQEIESNPGIFMLGEDPRAESFLLQFYKFRPGHTLPSTKNKEQEPVNDRPPSSPDDLSSLSDTTNAPMPTAPPSRSVPSKKDVNRTDFKSQHIQESVKSAPEIREHLSETSSDFSSAISKQDSADIIDDDVVSDDDAVTKQSQNQEASTQPSDVEDESLSASVTHSTDHTEPLGGYELDSESREAYRLARKQKKAEKRAMKAAKREAKRLVKEQERAEKRARREAKRELKRLHRLKKQQIASSDYQEEEFSQDVMVMPSPSAMDWTMQAGIDSVAGGDLSPFDACIEAELQQGNLTPLSDRPTSPLRLEDYPAIECYEDLTMVQSVEELTDSVHESLPVPSPPTKIDQLPFSPSPTESEQQKSSPMRTAKRTLEETSPVHDVGKCDELDVPPKKRPKSDSWSSTLKSNSRSAKMKSRGSPDLDKSDDQSTVKSRASHSRTKKLQSSRRRLLSDTSEDDHVEKPNRIRSPVHEDVPKPSPTVPNDPSEQTEDKPKESDPTPSEQVEPKPVKSESSVEHHKKQYSHKNHKNQSSKGRNQRPSTHPNANLHEPNKHEPTKNADLCTPKKSHTPESELHGASSVVSQLCQLCRELKGSLVRGHENFALAVGYLTQLTTISIRLPELAQAWDLMDCIKKCRRYKLSAEVREAAERALKRFQSIRCTATKEESSTPIQRPEGFGLLSHQFGSMSGRGALCSLGTSAQRPSTVVKFMRMLGPRAQGLAEFAVCAVESDNSDDRIVFCRCGNRLGLFDAVCCVCGATESPAHRMFHDLTDHIQPNQPESSSKVESELGSPVTQQPTQFSTLPSAFFDDWSNFNDCGIPELSSKTGTTASIQHIATLRSIPSSAKSAGASAETSPVRRWASSSRLQNRLVEPPGVSMVDGPRLLHLGHRPRHGSKVSEILDRFTRVGTTCERNGTTQPTLEQSSMPNVVRKCADVIVNPSEVSLNQQTVQQNSINNRTLSINKENHSDSNDGCLFRSRESHRRSFGQAWSWFKERRRFASVGLNASLTFLSIPSSSILMDILESKREPILKIAD